MSSEPSKPDVKLNILISPEAARILEQAKSEGISKKTFIDILAAAYECFNNLASFEATTPEILKLKVLKGIRDDALAKGASKVELDSIDEAIKAVKSVLKAYREKGEGVAIEQV